MWSINVIRVRRWFAVAGLSACIWQLVASSATVRGQDSLPEPPPLSPDASLRQISVREGYTLQLMAAEPLVADPVAIDWGADGRLWVAEMADYPYGMDNAGRPGGRVRSLEDTDGDGLYDRSVVFLDELSFPTAVMPWRDGVLVTAAPELFFARDTDGDGRADQRTVIARGFVEGNQQLRVNGLRFGLDNWVYCAAGGHHAGFGADNAIELAFTGQSLLLGSRDFRFDPDSGQLEPEAGPSQFGRVRNDWNEWFGVQNSHPLWHYVLEDGYLRRNPLGRYPDPRQQLRLPSNPEVFPTSVRQQRFHSFEHAGHYTSACGPCIYRDQLLFGPSPVTQAFTCEPFHNVVQHHWLHHEGVSYRGERAATADHYDFYASADRWSRPVMARTGPDGALWIVDMYRYMIEHPDWLPAEGRAQLEPYYRSGEDRGRIYRVFPHDQPPPSIPRLDRLTSAELVERLASQNGPVRDLAQRLLIHRRAVEVTDLLRRTVRDHPAAVARLHALYTLAGLQPGDGAAPHDLSLGPGLDATLLTHAMRDSHPQVRRHALRIAERLAGDDPLLLAEMVRLTGDSDAQVRLQLAFSLGETTDDRAGQGLVQLATQPNTEPFMTAALVSSATPHVAQLVRAAVEHPDDLQAGVRDTLFRMTRDRPELLASLLEGLLPAAGQQPASAELDRCAAWLTALAREGRTIESLTQADEPALRALEPRLRALFQLAWEMASDSTCPSNARVAAIRIVTYDPSRHVARAEQFAEWLGPQSPSEVQLATVELLARTADERDVAPILVAAWPQALPGVRAAMVDHLLQRPTWTQCLLDQIQTGGIAPLEIDPVRRDRLLHDPDPAVAARAAALFHRSVNSDRDQVLQRYLAALAAATEASDPERGQVLFAKHCANCHAPADGVPIGPNLKSLSDRSPAALLTAILDPSRAVEPKYIAYQVELKSGEVFYGVVIGESGQTLRLKQADGVMRELLRVEIEHLTSSRRSLMPDGLEAELTPRDLANLVSHVQQLE